MLKIHPGFSEIHPDFSENELNFYEIASNFSGFIGHTFGRVKSLSQKMMNENGTRHHCIVLHRWADDLLLVQTVLSASRILQGLAHGLERRAGM